MIYNKDNFFLFDDYIMVFVVDLEGKLWVGSVVGVVYFDV